MCWMASAWLPVALRLILPPARLLLTCSSAVMHARFVMHQVMAMPHADVALPDLNDPEVQDYAER